MTSEQKFQERLRSWARSKRAEGKAIGLRELVGHEVPKVWAIRMFRSGMIARERCPGSGLYAYWWL